MDITVNVNEQIKFKLTERGKKFLKIYIDNQIKKYRISAAEVYSEQCDGYIHTSLWEFMMVFGSFFNGSEPITENNEIIIEWGEIMITVVDLKISYVNRLM